MSTEETCQLCLDPIWLSDSNSGGYHTGQGRSVTMDHLWSYLYHQNVRECFRPSTSSEVTTDGPAKEFGLPKLTFSFSMGKPNAVNACDKDAAPSVRICEECWAEFEKLDNLHNQLERVKKSVECQALSINNCIRTTNNSVPFVLLGPVRNLEMSFGGSTIGKKNVSRALRFLSQLCDDGRPSATNSNPSLGPVDGETETVANHDALLLTRQSRTMKPGDSSISSNILNPLMEPANTIPSGDNATVDLTEPPFSTTSDGRFIMEVGMENAEYPEPETTETPAVMDCEGGVNPEANSLNSPQLASKNVRYSKISSRHRRLPPSGLRKENPDKDSRPAHKIFGNHPMEMLGRQKKKTDNKCICCGKVFIYNSHLIQHMRTHTGEKPFRCDTCHKRFTQLCHLKVHRRIHTGEIPYACDICYKSFSQQTTLQYHLLAHSGERPFKCHICNRASSRKHYRFCHLLKFHSAMRNADQSSSVISPSAVNVGRGTNAHLQKNVITLQSQSQPMELEGRSISSNILNTSAEPPIPQYRRLPTSNIILDASSGTAAEFREAVYSFGKKATKKSSQSFKEFCGILEPSSESKHKKLSDSKKTEIFHKSDIQLVINDGSLNSHLKQNSVEKTESTINQKGLKHCINPETLPPSVQEKRSLSVQPDVVSGESLKRQSGMPKDQTKKLDSKCEYCGKVLSSKWKLIHHIRRHTGEKPFECPVCNRRFTQSHDVTRHQRIHTGEKPFQCDTCHHKFALKTTLRNHLLVHSGERPFKCGICNRAFSRKSHLTDHQKIHSRKKDC